MIVKYDCIIFIVQALSLLQDYTQEVGSLPCSQVLDYCTAEKSCMRLASSSLKIVQMMLAV
jgi:hypothetical protein